MGPHGAPPWTRLPPSALQDGLLGAQYQQEEEVRQALMGRGRRDRGNVTYKPQKCAMP